MIVLYAIAAVVVVAIISSSILLVSKQDLWALAYSPDGSMIAVGGDDQTVRFWDPEDGTTMGPDLIGHQGPIRRIAFRATRAG